LEANTLISSTSKSEYLVENSGSTAFFLFPLQSESLIFLPEEGFSTV